MKRLLHPAKEKGIIKVIWIIMRLVGRIKSTWFFRIMVFFCHYSLFGFRAEVIKE